MPFQTRCRLQEVIEQGFPNPGFPNPGLVDTHHVLVHLYSEIGPSTRRKQLFCGWYPAQGDTCPLLELSRHKVEPSDGNTVSNSSLWTQEVAASPSQLIY